jgi:hypothetical protein
MDPHVAKTLAVLRTKRTALVEAHEGQLREIDAAIVGIQRYGTNGVDTDPAERPAARRRRTAHASKSGKTRAPRGQVPRLMLETLHAQTGHFSIGEISAYLDKHHPEDARRISGHRLSNEMHNAAKRKWIRLVKKEKGGRNTYVKDQLPLIKQ